MSSTHSCSTWWTVRNLNQIQDDAKLLQGQTITIDTNKLQWEVCLSGAGENWLGIYLQLKKAPAQTKVKATLKAVVPGSNVNFIEKEFTLENVGAMANGRGVSEFIKRNPLSQYLPLKSGNLRIKLDLTVQVY